MNELTLFWGNKDDSTFSWKLSKSDQKNHSQVAIHELQQQQILKADLACIADMAVNAKVSLVLSSSEVVSANLLVPNKAHKLLRKAIPYMMEDDIASPVDQLFFALSEKIQNSKLAVRAIERDYLDSLLDTFAAAEIKLMRLVSDSDLIEKPTEGYKVIMKDAQCLVVDQDNQRWHCHPEDFNWLIQKQINLIESTEDIPIAIPLNIVSQQAMDEFVHQLPVGRFAVEQTLVDDLYEYLLSESERPLNLLQAEYEPSKESSQLKKFAIKVASIAGLVLCFHLVYQAVNIYTLSETKAQLDQQKKSLLKQAFPNKRNPTEKDLRVYLKTLGSSSGDGGFLNLLNSTSQDLTDLTKIYPTNISYDRLRNELRMDVIASDLVALDQYADLLRKKGHKVEKSSETQRGEGYSSRLTITR